MQPREEGTTCVHDEYCKQGLCHVCIKFLVIPPSATNELDAIKQKLCANCMTAMAHSSSSVSASASSSSSSSYSSVVAGTGRVVGVPQPVKATRRRVGLVDASDSEDEDEEEGQEAPIQ